MKPFILLFFLLLLRLISVAQNIEAELGVVNSYSSNSSIPFWHYANRQGDIPLNGFSTALQAKLGKKYLYTDTTSWNFDYSFSLDTRLRVGNEVDFRIIEGKLGLKYGFFELVAGREREYSNLLDSNLSIGSFSLSGNSLGIPKVEIRIPNYVAIPGTKKMLAIKGRVLHGWMGEVPIHYGQNNGAYVNTFYHHLSAFGRLGKPHWKLKLEAGLSHDVVWGSDKFIFGDQYDLNGLEAFFYVLTGKAYKGPSDFKGNKFDISKIGNHLGTLDLAASYELRDWRLGVYKQFFYEKGALRYLANVRDGLIGFKLERKKSTSEHFNLKKVVLEYFYSKDQGGQFGAPWTPSGPEYYYNHGVYAEGFSYKGLSIGNPLITPAHLARLDLARDPKDYFVSNRVSAVHFGLMGNIGSYFLTGKVTYAKHFGDYHTSGPSEQWFNGKKRPQNFNYGIFTPVNQFSCFLEIVRPLKGGYCITGSFAGDKGGLLNNTFGSIIGFKKSW